MTLLSDIMDALGEAFPWELAPPSDGSGLLAGSLSSDVRGVTCALDPTSAALAAAGSGGHGLLLVHHPHLLRQPEALRDWDGPGGSIARRAAGAGVSIVACHLNADAAPGGIADMMAAPLSLAVEGPLQPTGAAYLATVVVFVPPEAADEVSVAMAGAGAGVIGEYSRCSFAAPGTGAFLPGDRADPHAGERGVLNRVPEVRLEMRAPSFAVPRVVAAMLAVHPYEQVAYEVYRSEGRVPWGVGRVGTLPEPRALADVVGELAAWCGSRAPAVYGEEGAEVRRLALMPGIADFRVLAAVSAGCDALVTGEVSLHGKTEAAEARMPLVCLGHHASEWPLVPRMAGVLEEASREHGWGLEVAVFHQDQEGARD